MRLSAVVAILAAAIGVAAPVHAQSPDEGARAEARVIGEEGLALFAQGDYAGALAKFDRAEALVPVPTLGVRAGRSLEKLGRWVEACERWLRTTTMPIDPSLPELYREAQARAQGQAEAERAALLPRIPRLEISVQGAVPDEVTVDGAVLPVALLGEKRPIDPGQHLIRARAGAAIAEERVTLAEGASTSVVLRLFASAPSHVGPPAPPARGPEAPAAAPPWRTIGWIGIGAGAAGVVAGVVTLGLALDRKSELEAAECNAHACAPSEGSGVGPGDVDAFNALATASTISFVAGGIIGAAGAILVLTAPRGARPKRGALTPALSATPGGAFAGARGSF